MAQVQFKGTVKLVREKFLVVVEKHSKKNPAGEWETTGFSDFQVWIPDHQRGQEFNERDLVEVLGRQKTETVEKDGKTYKNLVVSADSIEVVKSNDPVANVRNILKPIESEEMPF